MIRRLIYFSFLVVILFVVSTACATQTPPQPEANQSPKREESVEPTIEQEPESTTEDNDSLKIEETSTPSVSDDKVNYDQYFTNSVFVGDSVMEGFAQYVRGQRNSGVDMLSNAQFLTSLMGISVYDVVNATTDAKCYFTYRGKEQPLETILQMDFPPLIPLIIIVI